MTGAGDRPLVTVLGASGYLGSVLTALLADLPVRLRAVARRPSPVPARTTADVEVRTADLTDATSLAAAVADADVVLHLSKHSGGWRDAEGNPQSEPINVGVMRGIVRVMGGRTAAGPPPVVVFAATTSQVGLPPEHPMDGSEPDRPETVYDRQKLAAERMLLAASAEGVLRGVSLRLPTVFGRSPLSAVPDQGVVSTMIRRALAGEPLTMWHDGTVLRDLVPVEDAAGAFLAAMRRPDALAGRHWLVGTGRQDPLGTVFRTVAESVAAHTGRPPVPVTSVEPPANAPVIDFLSTTIDPAPFRLASGWSARTGLRDAVDRTVTALLDEAATTGREPSVRR
ncbi:NAD-dependent epimerase/dehydratase family protein [Streptomyces uncialis]|uniref:Oxidoreductase n=1 Tax=Streptomyces uncialis TaxID=1048205 RepID=A0A1Q4VEI7_9ACTN|nr:NAD-dependent epimerase/dehydratase [Streptomyces uncialis]OKH96180.1 oxidoreductase [Streptomyces uncialis]